MESAPKPQKDAPKPAAPANAQKPAPAKQPPKPAPKPAAKPPGGAEKVVTLRNDPKGAARKQRRRRMWTWLTFIPIVVAPIVAAIWYFMFVAQDRYAVEMKFSIRSSSGVVTGDLLGLVSGLNSSGSTMLDAYIVSDYIGSSGMLTQLGERLDLEEIYRGSETDPLMRFDANSTKEDLEDYFSLVSSVYFDPSSQVITAEFQAFSPENALRLAEEILRLCEELVNRLSEQARNDTVRLAELELERAEGALRNHRRALAAFRTDTQDLDPTLSATAQQTLVGTLESQMSAVRSERETLLQFLDEDAPQVRIRDSQIAALEDQLRAQRARLSEGVGGDAGTQGSLTERVGVYEELLVDLEFLQRAYVSALASLEGARLEANRQQRYVATFVQPALPQEAKYPRRVVSIAVIAISCLMAWVVGTMLVYIIREHAS